jgi:HSP20 family protein
MPRGPFFTHRPGGFGAGFFSGDVRETLQREMNRVFDEVWRNLPGDDESRPSGAASAAPRSFSVDVSETADEVRVRADLPGVAEQDVEVTLDDDRLTIRAERRSGRQSAGERSHVSECSVGRFERTVRVPGRWTRTRWTPSSSAAC